MCHFLRREGGNFLRHEGLADCVRLGVSDVSCDVSCATLVLNQDAPLLYI
jgi:hypothetical protein